VTANDKERLYKENSVRKFSAWVLLLLFSSTLICSGLFSLTLKITNL
jgi:hypothetical protein